jgi:hypothetical protein
MNEEQKPIAERPAQITPIPLLCAVYFRITSFEAGMLNTGKRSAYYHCYCEILDADKSIIKNHHLSDVFYGKWGKCQTVINKWYKTCEKAKLSRCV